MSRYRVTTEDVRAAFVLRPDLTEDPDQIALWDAWLAEHDAALVAERDGELVRIKPLFENLSREYPNECNKRVAAESERDAARERLRAAETVIAEAMAIPDRPEVVPIEETVRRHAYIKGMEVKADEFRTILSGYPVSPAPTERDAEIFARGVGAATDFADFDPADVPNPYRVTPTEEAGE